MTIVTARAEPLEGATRISAWWLVPPVILAAALIVTWSFILPWRHAALILTASAATAVPGVFVVRRIYRGEMSPWLAGLLIGPSWGYALTSLVLLAAWLAGLRDGRILFVAPLAAAGLGLALAPWFEGLLRAPVLTRRDVAAACLLLTLVPVIVARPYARVGADTGEGQAWRAYFTADTVWAVAVVSEVSKGDVPPRNPFRLGDALHYYWLAHLVPALEHRLAGPQVEIRQILLANAVLSGLALTAFLYFFARHFVASPIAAALGCAFVVCCHSFEGLEQLVMLWSWGAPLDLVQYMNIDAVTRWVYKGMPVDGLQRLLLYQPQHQLGYVVGMSALVVLLQARDRLRVRVSALVGALLSAALLLSTFSALMLTVMAVVWLSIEVVRRRAWLSGVACALTAAIPLAATVVLANALKYVEHGGSLVSLRVNPLAVHRWPLILFLSFGATVMAGGLGVWLAARAGALSKHVLSLLMIGVCVAFYFFVDVRDHQNVYVGWRAGHLLFIAAVPLVAAAFEHAWTLARPARLAALTALGVIAVLSLPTAAIDLYNTQDIENFGQAPNFRWTLLLTHDELEALRWIRRSTRPDAVVQAEPFLRDAATWAYIPAFAERRMAAGLPISMIPAGKYERASERVRRLYQQTSGEDAYQIATHLGIDYLVIGPPEALRYPQLGSVLEAVPFRWRLAFHNNTMRIYAPVR